MIGIEGLYEAYLWKFRISTHTNPLTLNEIFAKLNLPHLLKTIQSLKENVAMKAVIYLLGLGLIAYCTYFNLYTRQAASSLERLFQTYQLKYLAAIPALFAILFILSATAAQCPWPFWIVGILAAIEAVIAYTNPKEIYSKTLDWLFENVTDQAYKIVSLIGIIFGTLILTLA
jgi:hypothetical protein